MIDDPLDLESQAAGPTARERAGVVMQYAAIARERFTEAREHVKAYVDRQPVRALGIALGVGVLIGWITKRR